MRLARRDCDGRALRPFEGGGSGGDSTGARANGSAPGRTVSVSSPEVGDVSVTGAVERKRS